MHERGAIRALERDLSLASWTARRNYRAKDYTADALLERKDRTVSVIVPARSVAGCIGAVVEALVPLEQGGLIDELVVVDAASEDGTAERAEVAGASVLQESDLMPEHGPARGKGDAMWRGLAATSGEIVAFLDADTHDFHAGFLLGLLGPMLEDETLALVKGSFRRPLRVGQEMWPDEGGRVTELMARPLINLHVPELAGFHQPLAGEVAARRNVLEPLSFPVGYGVEIAMMIDVARTVGLEAMAQVDLGTRQNRHQPLRELGAMAYAVMVAAMRRVQPEAVAGLEMGPLAQPCGDSLETRDVPIEERPSLVSLRARSGGGDGRAGATGAAPLGHASAGQLSADVDALQSGQHRVIPTSERWGRFDEDKTPLRGPRPRARRPMIQAAEPAPAVVSLVEVEQAPILARPYFPATGPASPLTASLAHVPEVLEVALPFIGRVLGPTALDARTKEIVVLRTSALMECSYCVQTHTAAALDSGLARAQIEALRGEADVEGAFADAGERALIAWVEEVALGRGSVGEEVAARAREAMGDPELVELTLVVGATLMLNRYCTALRLPTSAATLQRLAEEALVQ